MIIKVSFFLHVLRLYIFLKQRLTFEPICLGPLCENPNREICCPNIDDDDGGYDAADAADDGAAAAANDDCDDDDDADDSFGVVRDRFWKNVGSYCMQVTLLFRHQTTYSLKPRTPFPG